MLIRYIGRSMVGLMAMVAVSSTGSAGDDSLRRIQQLVISEEWACRYTHKSILAANSLGVVGNVPRACLTKLKCEKLGGEEWTFTLACKASGRETCPALRDCISDEARRTAGWGNGRETTKEAQRKGRDKYGRNCRYAWGNPLVVYRKDGETGELDAVCTTPIACDNFDHGPKHHVVACPTTGRRVKEEDGLQYDVCPRVNDCIDNELPLERAFTAAELQQLQARGRVQTSAPAKANHRP